MNKRYKDAYSPLRMADAQLLKLIREAQSIGYPHFCLSCYTGHYGDCPNCGASVSTRAWERNCSWESPCGLASCSRCRRREEFAANKQSESLSYGVKCRRCGKYETACKCTGEELDD